MNIYKCCCLVTVFFLSVSAFARVNGDSTQPTTATAEDSIVRIYNLNSINPNSPSDSAKINEIIGIQLSTQKPVAVFNTLYIDGIKVGNLKPWKASEFEKTVFFQLNDSVEKLLLEFTESKAADKSVIAVNFSTGTLMQPLTRGNYPIYVEVKQRIKSIWVWLMSLLFIGLIIAALKYNALKDDNNLYYSLGRTQLFYWTILFVFSYLYICFKTGALPDIPGSMLVIIGISVGTTAFSKIVENNHKGATVIDPTAKSEGWFLDLLSDGTSINIQRFQNVIFNLVFGIIFIQKTFITEVMLGFDNNTLLLLGISSGTYAGLKITEASKEQNQPPVPVNSDPAPAPAPLQPAPVPAAEDAAPPPAN